MTDEPLIIPQKGEDGTKTFSIRVKQDIVDRIDEISVETNRSRNELISILLAYALKHCKIEK